MADAVAKSGVVAGYVVVTSEQPCALEAASFLLRDNRTNMSLVTNTF